MLSLVSKILLSIGVFFSISAQAQLDLAVSVTGDYAASAMTELAASPPLLLLKNEEGKKRHEVLAGYLKMSADDDAVTTSNGTAEEVGEASGFGISYGYSKSFKERWSFYIWAQAATYSGDHVQTTSGVVTTRTDEMDGLIANLALGVSYEFLKDYEKHTLNVFGGPSLMYFDAKADVKTFNAVTAAAENDIEMEISTLLPAFMLGTMYEAKWFEKWQIAFYGMINLTFEECVAFDTPVVNLSSGNSFSSPECDASTSLADAETDIATSFFALGFKVRYVPWKLGINISSILRNAIFSEEEDERAEVDGVLLSLSKSWGDD